MEVKLNTRKYNTRRADYLLRNKNNERSETIDIRGIIQDQDATQAFKELNTRASKDREKKFFMSASLNPQPGYDDKMTREDWMRAAEIAEDILKLTGQPRIMVMHEKIGKDGIARTHCHVDWFREKEGRLISDSNYKYKAQNIERDIELALDHPRTALANRDKFDKQRALGRVAEQVLEAAQDVAPKLNSRERVAKLFDANDVAKRREERQERERQRDNERSR